MITRTIWASKVRELVPNHLELCLTSVWFLLASISGIDHKVIQRCEDFACCDLSDSGGENSVQHSLLNLCATLLKCSDSGVAPRRLHNRFPKEYLESAPCMLVWATMRLALRSLSRNSGKVRVNIVFFSSGRTLSLTPLSTYFIISQFLKGTGVYVIKGFSTVIYVINPTAFIS